VQRLGIIADPSGLAAQSLGLVSNCPELAILANPDKVIENAIFNYLSLQRLLPSKCGHVPVPNKYLSRIDPFWACTYLGSPANCDHDLVAIVLNSTVV